MPKSTIIYPNGRMSIPASLIGAVSESQIYLCEVWISEHLKPTKTIRKTMNSYGYKHDVERWTEQIDPDPSVSAYPDVPWLERQRVYIAEESFIEAMARAGYRVSKLRHETYFNATSKERRRRLWTLR